MKTAFSEQQTAFYTKNGYLEVELPPVFPQQVSGYDLWRSDEALKQFLLRKMGPLVLQLTGRPRLHLAYDRAFAADALPQPASPIQHLSSIQSLAIGVAMAKTPAFSEKRLPLGILPCPSKPDHLLFFRPDLILDWPHVHCDLYIALFALPVAVYIQNPKDPFNPSLKALGYHFGDTLKNEFHPLILRS